MGYRRIGIVGHEAAKFTPETEAKAKRVIAGLIARAVGVPRQVVSGHCHLGGVDIWAEEMGRAQGLEPLIFPPKTKRWNDGYKPRNIQIAENSDELHCIVVAEYPAT